MLNELKAYKNLDVYVTGSNSKGLSSDIATEFRGRATQIRVHPLSFDEYYSYTGGDERRALDIFMLYGGMPRILSMKSEKDKKDYLSSLYAELYIKDIVERNGVEREDILNDVLNFLASQISSLTNPTNIANALTSVKKEKVNPAISMILSFCGFSPVVSTSKTTNSSFMASKPFKICILGSFFRSCLSS